MHAPTPLFEDRMEAGRRLAQRLKNHILAAGGPPLVLALPRGGVEVGFEVAKTLGSELGVIVARKLGAPSQPELGMGAVAPGGVRILDERIVRCVGAAPAEVEQVVAAETAEMERRQTLYSGGYEPELAGRNVILVDDGLATGATARAACRSIRQRNPKSLILAAPVCSPQSLESVRGEADDIVCLYCPPEFAAVGHWYRDFAQTTDEQVIDLLDRINRPLSLEQTEERIMEDSGARVPSAGPAARPVEIYADGITLNGDLTVPNRPRGVVLFAHGSGSGRTSPRNQQVAKELNNNGFATLVLDLLTQAEEAEDQHTRQHRFDVRKLAGRLVFAAEWLRHKPETEDLRIGYYGASTGAAAALIAAVHRSDLPAAIVSRGGRPDLAGDDLIHVHCPCLFIVGGADEPIIPLNRQALDRIPATDKRIEVIPGATHLFEEPGALDEVSRLSTAWFISHLDRATEARAA